MAELGGYIGEVKLKDVQPLPKDAPVTQAPTTEGQPATEAIDVAKSALNGAQIASLIDVVAKIKEGVLTSESALSIVLASFPTIDERTARRIVGIPATPTPLVQSCDKHTFSDDEIKVFSEFGESNEDYIVLGNIPIEWNTPNEEVMKRHEQIFETIGRITGTTPGGK